jgi:hypothetical protein
MGMSREMNDRTLGDGGAGDGFEEFNRLVARVVDSAAQTLRAEEQEKKEEVGERRDRKTRAHRPAWNK